MKRATAAGRFAFSGRRARLRKRQAARYRRRIAHKARIRMAQTTGYSDGYRMSHGTGYHLGFCEGLMQALANRESERHDVHLLYVTTGMGVPYAPIDEAVAEALSRRITRLTVCRPMDDVVAIAEKEKPDAMLVLNGMNMDVAKVEPVRQMGVRTAVWMTDDPYYSDVTGLFAVHYDHVFTLEMSCVDHYRSMGCEQVHYLPFANDFRVYRPHMVDQEKWVDVLFLGSGYWNRIRFFDGIAPYLATKNVLIAGWWWDRLSNYHLLSDKIRLGEWMTPELTSDYYAGAKIVINLHRAPDDDSYNRNTRRIPAHSINPRTFEIAGSGAFQLTDMRPDLPNHYVPGQEIAIYESPEDLIGKIEYYLAREDERHAIARAGLKRTLKDHSYVHRLDQLLQTMFAQSMTKGEGNT